VFIFVAPYLRYDTWQTAPLRPAERDRRTADDP